MKPFTPLYTLPATVLLATIITCLLGPLQEPESPFTGDISQPVKLTSLGEDIYEGFPMERFIDTEYECFLRAVYIEAYSESIVGQQAVGQVLYNRYVSGKFPNDLCDIINQRNGRLYQFPWMKYGHNRKLSLEDNVIDEMSEYLASVYMGVYTVPKLERATYFKRCDVKGASWWNSLKMVAKIGDHCFYRLKLGE